MFDHMRPQNRRTVRPFRPFRPHSSGLHTTCYSTRAYPATHAVKIQQQIIFLSEATQPPTSQQPENSLERSMRTDRPPPANLFLIDRHYNSATIAL